MKPEVLPGQSFPLGATVRDGGVNFCLYAKGAIAVELLLFETPNAPKPQIVVALDRKLNKTFHYWHAFIPHLRAGQVYAYRVHGPYLPHQGVRFDGTKVLLDPYAKAVAGWENYRRKAAIEQGDNCAHALRSVVVDPSTYDWEGDVPLNRPYSQTTIYELHVGGFTRHPSSGLPPEKRGTYAGLIEKIPYLKSLGITAVELMPIHQFDEEDARPGLENYWGYSTMAFFAPHHGYSFRQDPLGPVDEFRDMVKALHRAGIEVILDVVFNHTAEGNHEGPTLSFRGLSNEDYYVLESNRTYYANYSGCGNTFKMGAVGGNLILDCLRYWASEMHVDGFRFDLASILSRGVSGQPSEHPPILWMINSDPVLASAKIIAEAWDAGGLYQVGQFAGERFAEWNGPYRDDVRRFVKGDAGMVKKFAARLLGSPDIYPHPDREPNYSINFITCHDGFTLCDLVSYNQKHNEANDELNRDGSNENWSWNCSVEGETHNPAVECLRCRQIRNFLTILFMSQGTPMLLMGDEIKRSQLGNNNAYCQNNETSWFNWQAIEQNQSLLHFVKGLLAFVQTLELFTHDRFFDTEAGWGPYISWHGTRLGQPDWGYDSHSLALSLNYPQYHEHLHLIFNAYWEPLVFELPPLNGGAHWHRIIDTALPSPRDFCQPAEAPRVRVNQYKAKERSVVVLMAQLSKSRQQKK
jgi:glycogen operon protein